VGPEVRDLECETPEPPSSLRAAQCAPISADSG